MISADDALPPRPIRTPDMTNAEWQRTWDAHWEALCARRRRVQTAHRLPGTGEFPEPPSIDGYATFNEWEAAWRQHDEAMRCLIDSDEWRRRQARFHDPARHRRGLEELRQWATANGDSLDLG